MANQAPPKLRIRSRELAWPEFHLNPYPPAKLHLASGGLRPLRKVGKAGGVDEQQQGDYSSESLRRVDSRLLAEGEGAARRDDAPHAGAQSRYEGHGSDAAAGLPVDILEAEDRHRQLRDQR
jgi:hypothetical protein